MDIAQSIEAQPLDGGPAATPRAGSGLPRISIVIPTRNEAGDIVHTLESCLALDYPTTSLEVIVVDDSTDETPEIVGRFASRGVRLIHRPENANGCCGARNEGIRAAGGEIVVLLNADAVPEPDFLMRVVKHYERGADYVVVRSTVLNQDSAWGRLIEAETSDWLSGGGDMQWSEGFSCRRAAALEVGLIPGDFPVPFCRDWRLGAGMSARGFRKVTDLSIRMRHVVPGTPNAFWRHSIWRGTMIAPAAHYFGGRSVGMIAIREVLRAVRAVTLTVLVVPGLVRAAKLARFSGQGWRDLLRLWVAATVRDMGVTVGCIRGALRVARGQ